ncbi:glycerol-3-phosphate dehydrogenase [Anaerotaenia torta]|uniref:NAD(P)/FAD-dependent oxidoreductase n=1 Tax=Anaerotaenia torta TaxID=433293 RepID=UPI003D1B9B11
MRYDVIIIGAGVSGCAVARELSRYELKVFVLEKEEDVCSGTSKANSAIIHAGYDAEEGTLKAKLNVEGNRMMDELCRELEIPFKRNGSLVVCTDENDLERLDRLYQRGLKNGVKGLRIIGRTELLSMEPNVSQEGIAALYAPTAGIICPFTLNIAMAENAFENGAEFSFHTEVTGIEKSQEGYQITTTKGIFTSRWVVNAAGVYADTIHNMISENKIKINPRRGDYYLLDKSAGDHVSKTIFELPGRYGKGVLVAPTIHGNLLVGPTAIEVSDKEGTDTTAEGMSQINGKSRRTVRNLPLNTVITSFAGLRADAGKDFMIKELQEAERFIDCAGIKSPGLTAAPAIGKMVADMITEKADPKKKANYIYTRKAVPQLNEMSFEERKALINQNPAYGNIICRCEMISEGEIVDAINRPLGARTLDGVKRRARAGSGRCQAGFCMPRTMEIIARELNCSIEEVRKNGMNSNIILGKNKDSL